MFYMTENGLEPMVPVQSEGDGQEHGSGQETPDSPRSPGSMYSAKFLESINVFNGDLTCCKRYHLPCSSQLLSLDAVCAAEAFVHCVPPFPPSVRSVSFSAPQMLRLQVPQRGNSAM